MKCRRNIIEARESRRTIAGIVRITFTFSKKWNTVNGTRLYSTTDCGTSKRQRRQNIFKRKHRDWKKEFKISEQVPIGDRNSFSNFAIFSFRLDKRVGSNRFLACSIFSSGMRGDRGRSIRDI